MNFHSSLADDQDLTVLLHAAAWAGQDLRRSARIRVLDEADLGPSRLLVVAAEETPGTRYFVPVMRAEPGREAVRHPAHDRAVVQAMRDKLSLPTAAGNVIRFDGDPAPFRGSLPFDPGWSTNALSLADLGGSRHIHKAYRRITADTREPRLLRLMHAGGRTQRWVGDYCYVEARTGEHSPLGLVYAYADGDSLDLPLRRSIRSMWPVLHAGADPSAAVTSAQRPLVDQLPAVGRFLRDLHTELADRLGPVAPIPVPEYLRQTGARVAALRTRIDADDRYPHQVRAVVAAALHEEWERASAVAAVPWPAGPSHGDLHLSHILRQESADGWRLCVIDLSTPADDPADPVGSAQSPWQDVAALLRGLEIFTADELIHQAAERLGTDQDDTCRTMLMLGAGHRPDTPGWTTSRLVQLRRMQESATRWSGQVRQLLLTGYAGTPGTTVNHPAWRIFRLRRLLHELDYAYTHDQHYHAAINLRHVLQTYRPTADREH